MEKRDKVGYLGKGDESNMGIFQITPICSVPNRTCVIFFGHHLWEDVGL